MKFSIVTPTHLKNAFLEELYASIKTQTYEDWEWIIFINGGASATQVAEHISNDPKVKIFVSNENNNCVGYIKNTTFNLAGGDIIVEVDHDDLLTDDCLEELHKAFQDQDIGFVYSNDAIWHMKNEFVPYDASYGWTYREANWEDKRLFIFDSFEPSSHSLAFIWYSPDHVRAWRKSVYQELGGHNPKLDVCDDHDLLIRTYLHSKMKHVPKPLYIYRITGENTWLERNKAIQTRTVQLFHKYAWDLACKDAKDKNLHIVELGGGINPKPGTTINIDLEEGTLKHDLNNGIPLPDNSVGAIWASHILEHLHDKHKIISEIHRVLVDGGWAFIQVPSTDGRGAFQDPTHVSYWNENCFWYYTRKDKAAYIRNDTIKFQSYKLDTFYWEPRSDNIAITDAWLVAIKENKRRPHLLTI